jgi:hypothetical protein
VVFLLAFASKRVPSADICRALRALLRGAVPPSMPVGLPAAKRFKASEVLQQEVAMSAENGRPAPKKLIIKPLKSECCVL